jgi:hypothetical protein
MNPSWRDIFHYTTHPEVFLDDGNLLSLIDRAGMVVRDATEPDLDQALATLKSALASSWQEWRELWSNVSGEETRARLINTVITQSAPLAASLGAWLQGLSAPGVFEDQFHLKSLALLADDLGVGRPEASRQDAFRLIALRAGLPECAGSVRDLYATRAIYDSAFCLPGLLHALSRRSDAFAVEIAGVDLAFRTAGLIPAWRAMPADPADDRQWTRLDLSRSQGTEFPPEQTPQALSRSIAERYAAEPRTYRRVCAGIAWLNRGLGQWDAGLRDLCRSALDPRQAMAHLIQQRAQEASVYHHGIRLQGKSLARWFTEARSDPFPLVDALEKSRFVSAGDPSRSPLINGLISPSGPMFRIFRNEDVALIRRWIEFISSGARTAAGADRLLPLPSAEPDRPPDRGDVRLGAVPNSIRQAYYLLQGRAIAPRTHAFAAEYVRKRLKASKRLDGSNAALPATWSAGVLRAWLLHEHDNRGAEFEQHRADPMPSRDELINSTLQLAPLTLIDGAWLQGYTDCALARTPVGSPLFKIYWDELGNGDYSLNHPKIYRELLRAMDIELPPTGSVEFALDERFDDASFRLPVFWLCLGKFPITFRAEILGMNLAMELSGVGGSYRVARQFLRHYGFPTAFVDIHNTIDNVSTGHSGSAADAVDAHMRSLPESTDINSEWDRIRSGYRSLAPAVGSDAQLDYFPRRAARCRRIAFAADVYHHATT